MDASFFIDSEDFPEEEKHAFEEALKGLANSDMPLSVEVELVSEEEIRRLNREIRGKDSVTDVLSFPAMELVPGEEISAEENADCIDEENRLLLGSVAVCEKRAREQAEEYGHSVRRELYYLTVHGILHCLGYDHETEEERAKMREREEWVMKKMNLGRGS